MSILKLIYYLNLNSCTILYGLFQYLYLMEVDNSTYKTSEKDVENFKIKFSKKKKLIYLNIVIKNLG